MRWDKNARNGNNSEQGFGCNLREEKLEKDVWERKMVRGSHRLELNNQNHSDMRRERKREKEQKHKLN